MLTDGLTPVTAGAWADGPVDGQISIGGEAPMGKLMESKPWVRSNLQ